MQARLLACQADVISERGAQGSGMVSVLKHFSWAPHRWESFAQPRRQYCCMLAAIFKCLGSIAGDWRNVKATRERAERHMDMMSGRHGVEIGLSGDYSEMCLRFIRKWDTADRDCAKSRQLLDAFRKDVSILFLQGYVFCAPPPPQQRHPRPARHRRAASKLRCAP